MVTGAIYHWFPLITGRFLDENLANSILDNFFRAYSIYFPMHYLGFIGVPRRYFEMYNSPYMPSTIGMNEFISIAVFVVGAAQFIFFNVVKSIRLGKPLENPWKANSLGMATPDVPPAHGNWGENFQLSTDGPMILVCSGAKEDYIPQTTPE